MRDMLELTYNTILGGLRGSFWGQGYSQKVYLQNGNLEDTVQSQYKELQQGRLLMRRRL